MIRSNFHTHTVFCDGNDTPEELVQAALALGFKALGFSGHSYNEPDKDFAMPPSAFEYRKTVNALKAKYKGVIDIFCGIEQDYFSDEPTDCYDYVIGSVHYVKKNGGYIAVDDTADIINDGVNRLYGGDFDALAEDYFNSVSNIAEKTHADIIGHFDLVSKFSEQNGRGESERFLSAAENAVKALVPYNIPFEINTGAVAKGYRSVPYPSPAILKIIKQHGGKIIFSSDCHDKSYLAFGFDTAEKTAYEIGFRERAVITKDGIKYIKL